MSLAVIEFEHLKTRCDALWREAILGRDKWRCRKCGKAATDAAHVFTRGVYAVRWLLENGLALCRDCHGWAHAHPAAFKAWARAKVGALTFDRLEFIFNRAAEVPVNLTMDYLKAQARRLTKAVRRYGGWT